jgi:acyl-CoA hydrolase
MEVKMNAPRYFETVSGMIDALLAKVGPRIVLGIPLGIGKPNHFVNALYHRVAANPDLHLTILTALSLQKPAGASELEQRFIGPLAERVFGDYPDLEYVLARKKGRLPPNVRVIEQFLKTGDYLNNDLAQQDYLYSNYTNVARDMLLQGVNVLAQAVATRPAHDGAARPAISLAGNPDITLDVFDMRAARPELNLLTIACYNQKLPFMENQAEVDPGCFDWVLTDPEGTHDLFAPPNMKVSMQDYAIALYASSLVKDGGTLQIGIGSLGDAIAQALLLREQDNPRYRQLMDDMYAGQLPAWFEAGRFEQGLYGCSEMFVNGFMRLIDAGLIRREVFDHEILQTLLNQKKIGMNVTPDTLAALRDAGAISPVLTSADLAFLQRYGVFLPQVQWQQGQLQIGEKTISPNIAEPASLQLVASHCLGPRLQGGIFMHGGFFLGPRDFYQALRDLTPEVRKKIGMSRISFVNRLGDEVRLVRAQRQHARFINTTMRVSLLGACGSDSLDSGRVVSGVGGQYNFVAMADSLPDARSILMLRATHAGHGKVWSNLVWSIGQTTIPRHLRDIIITEYGVADLRGQIDSECVKRLLAITDSRFQEELLAQAKAQGKLEVHYQIPAEQRHNLPEMLEARLRPWRERGCLPDFPFGTDFTEDELVIVRALRKLKGHASAPLELIRSALHGLRTADQVPPRYLERMHLNDDEVEGIKMRLMRVLFMGNLS